METMLRFAEPRRVDRQEDCYFYHTMDLPDGGTVVGDWDLRGSVDAYLGGMSFANKRILEIGPASGFLTIEMEKRGAEVVAVEVEDEPGWDFVPYPPPVLNKETLEQRKRIMAELKNSFWYTHAAHHSKAKLIYGSAYQLPDALGEFDVALMAAVLLHCHSPLQIIEQCARRAKVLVITDMFYPELEGRPVCRLAPTEANKDWGTWWHFSTDLLVQYLRVMGFGSLYLSRHTQVHQGASYAFFTIVAAREPISPSPPTNWESCQAEAAVPEGPIGVAKVSLWRRVLRRLAGV